MGGGEQLLGRLTCRGAPCDELQQLCIDELELAILREAEGAREVAQLEEEVSGRALLLERHEVPLLGPELTDVELSQVEEGLAARVVQLEEDGAVLIERLVRARAWARVS